MAPLGTDENEPSESAVVKNDKDLCPAGESWYWSLCSALPKSELMALSWTLEVADKLLIDRLLMCFIWFFKQRNKSPNLKVGNVHIKRGILHSS